LANAVQVGGFAAGMRIGKTRYFKTNWCLLYGCIFKVAADGAMTSLTPDTVARGLGLSFLSMIGTGWISVSLIVCVQLACDDGDIGLATLLLGSIRAVGGSVAITIYSTILNNKLQNDAPLLVAQAVLPLGLPMQLLEPLIYALINEQGPATLALPGMTPEILAAGDRAMKESWGMGFRYIYLTGACFAGGAFIAALITKDSSDNMTDHVAVRLENERPKERAPVLESGAV